MKRVLFLISLFFFLVLTINAQNRTQDALTEHRNGNFERAIQLCRDEINENPNNLDAHVIICWGLLRLNRFEEALRFARAGRAINRFDIRIIEILGEIHYNMGLNNEALQFFQEYAALAPEGQRIEMIYYYMGEVYIRQGRFRHADIALSTAVHWVPGNAAWWVRLAYARENTGDLSSALEAYERALSLNSQLTDAQRGLDRIRRSMGDTQIAYNVQSSTVASVVARPALTGNITLNNTSPRAGDTIAASYSGNGTGTPAWQWLVDDTVITGATGSYFVARQADVGRTLRARVSYANQNGTVTSGATGTVARAARSGTMTLNNTTPRAGDTIAASYAGNGTGTATWQWLADDAAIGGATGSTYIVRPADVGRTLRARVSYVNQNGTVTSNATGIVARPGLTGTVTLSSMMPREGDFIAASYAGNGAGTATWQWLADDAVISGAAGSTYVVRAADIGRTLRASVSYANQSGAVTSGATSPVARPSLSGTITLNVTTPREGDVITASYSGNGSGTATWQWLVGDTTIGGVTGNTYTVRAADVGRTLRARVSFANQNGSITSSATNSVARPSLSGAITLSTMTPRVGDTVTADYSGNGTGTATWQWLADDVIIRGATNNTFIVRPADIGRTLRARVSYTNQTGSIMSGATNNVNRAP
jgi:tetratricopeptide (TPR) repeat protein